MDFDQDRNDELIGMNRYQRALRNRVDEACRFRLTHGRAPTQEELGPMPVAADFPGLEAEIAANMAVYSARVAAKAESLSAKRARQLREKMAAKRDQRRVDTGLVGVYQSERADDGWRAHFKPEEYDPGYKKRERRFRSLIDACKWRNKTVDEYYGPGERDDLKCDMGMIYRLHGKHA